MIMNDVLNSIFGSKTRVKILVWFFTHADEEYFVRQVAPILQEDPTNVSREMARLEKVGILVSARAGNLKQFRVNRSCSFFDELKGLILKTAGVAGQIKSLLEAVKGIEFAFIYGSFAGGRENADSDVDLLIVGDVDLNVIDAALQRLEKALGRSVNYVLYDPQEFKEKVTTKDGFISNVLDGEKIALVGDLRGL